MSFKNSILVVCILVLGGVLVVHGFSSRNTEKYSDESASFNRAYWKEEIQKQGPQKAYTEFKDMNARAPQDRQHVATHVIGELLYELEGTNGIQYCDSSFGFGCYHGFFGRAVATHGIALIPELDKTCVSFYGPLGTGCQHGIGHGIMEYVGGDRVSEALALCKETTQLTKLLGCTSGVFMEYNTPLAGVGEGEAPAPRPFDESNPYKPCTDIESAYQESCYYELGQWFAYTFKGDEGKQGGLCADIPSALLSVRCFMGLGTFYAPASGYDVTTTLGACDAAGNGGILACRAGASWSFYADPSVRDSAKDLCELGSVVQKEQCLALADLTEGLRDPGVK